MNLHAFACNRSVFNVLFKETSMDRLIRWPELRRQLGGDSSPTRTTIWRWQRAGKFPKCRRIQGISVWIQSEIDAWIENVKVA